MKKIWKLFLLLFVFISFINLVYALDCQYTQPNYATKEEIVFYENGKKLDYQVIEIKDFSQGVYSQIYVLLNRPAQFTVYNHHPSKKLLIEIFFTKNGNLDNATIEVDPLGYKSISRDYQDNIDFNTIRFRILDESINVKNELIEYIVDTTCKLCNSKICLDDGASCKSNNECGSGICNIADFCGKEKVVACEPYGKLNCNNQTCLMPSTKEVGDAYSCNWECKSDRYEEGICLKSSMQLREEKDKRTRNIIIFGVIIFVVILISYLYIEKRKRGKVKKEREEEERKRDVAKKEREETINEKERLEDEIKRSNGELKRLKQKEEDLINQIQIEEQKSREKIKHISEEEAKEIRILQERKKNKKIEAQRTIDEEIRKIRKNRQEEIERAKKEEAETLSYLNSQIKNNKSLILEKKSKELKLREKTEKLTKEIAEIENTSPERKRKRLLHEYINNYETNSRKIKYDNISGRFMITSQYHSPEFLSRYIYKKYVDSNIGNKEIHHINYDEIIDKIWNLIALSKEDHNKIKHSNLDKGDWVLGLEQLKEIGYGTKEKPFPEHIQKEIKKRKEQKHL